MNLFAVLVASLAGSGHCAGMCGGFVGYLCGNSQSSFGVQSLYHLGRLTSYLALGALAGLLGSSFDDLSSQYAGVQHVTAILVGILLIYWGIQTIRSRTYVNIAKSSWLEPVQRLYRYVVKNKEGAGSNWFTKAFAIGLLSSFLPCGWLYAYVLVAASAGSPTNAMLVMFVFWLGTVPALLGVGFFGAYFSRMFGEKAPSIIGCLLIVAGLVSIGLHSGLPFLEPATQHCH